MVSGSLRVTDLIYGNFKIINAPISSASEDYGPGQNAQILKSNGTNVYWSDTALKAMKDQNGDVIDTTYVKLRGTNEISADNTFTGLNIFDKGTADTYVYAGKPDSTRNNAFRARSNNTSIGLYANSDGSRGLWAYANGDVAAQGILKVDSNNDIFYNGGTFTGSNVTRINTIDAMAADNGVSSLKYTTNFSIEDKNDLILSRLENIANPSGTISAYWYVRNYNGTTTYVAQKGIKMTLDKGGNLTYAISDPERMRSALGVDGICYGTCDTAQATQAKVATLTSDKGFILTTGATVAIRFTYAAANSTMTLNVNGTGAKNLYQYGTALMSSSTTTSGWPAGAVVIFVYDATLNSGNGGWTRIFWNNLTEPSNITSRGTQAGLEAETSANGGVGLSRYAISMMTKNQKWSNIAHVEGSTAADQGASSAKKAATADFLLDSPIYYTNTNVYIAPGASGSMNGYNITNFSLRHSIGTTSTAVNLVAPKPVYLVGIPNDDGATFKLYPTQWWTQDPNTFTDKAGKIFIYLGIANSASNMYLSGTHPIYYHDGTTLYPYVTSKKIFTTSISGDTLYHSKNGTSYIIPDGRNDYAAGRIWGITVPTNPYNTYYANKTVELITDNNQLCLYNRTDSSMIWSIPVLAGGTSTVWPISQGGTGASSAQNAKSNLGLGDLNLGASNTYGGSVQHWGISGIVASTSTITRAFDQKRTHLIIKDNGLYLYNGTDDTGVWDISIHANNIVMSVYNTPTETNPGQLKKQFRLAYKEADDATVGNTNAPIYLNNTGSAAACTAVDVAHGGTGATSFTANRIIVSNASSTTGALTTREILTASTVTHLNWGSSNDAIPNKAMLAYWNGRYNASASNLQYCDRGRFGTIVTHDFYYNSKPTSGVATGALAFIPI